jgi:hypothetical protein
VPLLAAEEPASHPNKALLAYLVTITMNGEQCGFDLTLFGAPQAVAHSPKRRLSRYLVPRRFL